MEGRALAEVIFDVANTDYLRLNEAAVTVGKTIPRDLCKLDMKALSVSLATNHA